MKINERNIRDSILKVSQRKYLEDIINGHLYFNNIAYFRDNDEQSYGDSREGKIRIKLDKNVEYDNDIVNLIKHQDIDELNLSAASVSEIPVFCCSIITPSILKPDRLGNYELTDSYIEEMNKWGNTVLHIQLDEFLFKLDQCCKIKNIKYFADVVKYDRDEHIVLYKGSIQDISDKVYQSIFHKSNEFKNQNEFRVALFCHSSKLREGHYLDIEPLKSASILVLNSLHDMGIRVI